jgi:hypothetical protein
MNTQEKVEKLIQTLGELCATPAECLDVLVPSVAATLAQVRAQPPDVEEFFLRVTALLDQREQGVVGGHYNRAQRRRR